MSRSLFSYNNLGFMQWVFWWHCQQYSDFIHIEIINFACAGNQGTRRKYRTATSQRQTLLLNVISSTPHHGPELNFIGDRHCLNKSIYQHLPYDHGHDGSIDT